MGRLFRSTCVTTQHHHDCCCCSQSQEGRRQAQGPRCPPPLRRHGQGCRTCQARPEEAGHLQGYRRCCCSWQEGSWLLQTGREAQGCQTRQGKEEARCQEGQEAR